MLARTHIFLLFAVVTAAFATCGWFEFIPYDDQGNIYQNKYLLDLSLHNVAHFWTSAHDHLYMPVTFTVWSLLAALSRTFSGSMNPAYFHIANVLVHAVNSALVYLILCRLSHRQGALTTKQRGAALCGALFFALHPLVVEPVAWAMGMKDLAAATLSLAAMWRYLLFLPEGRRSLYWQAVVCMLGALLCKPSAALIPATLFILEIYWEQLPWHRALKRLLPWCGVGVIALVLTKYLQPDGELPFSTQWTDRPLIAADAVAFYLQKLWYLVHQGI